MKTSKKIALITAGACLVLGAAVSVSAFAKMDYDFKKLDTAAKVTNEVIIEDKFNSIDIDDSSSDIKILPAKDNKCRVVFYEDEEERHTAKVENDTLNIESDNSASWFSHFHFFSFQNCFVEVYLPEKEYSDLDIEVSSGNIDISDSFYFKNAYCECSSGDIKVGTITADTLTAKCTSGDVEVNGVKADTVETNCTSGDIIGNDINCKSFSANATSGDIELKNVVSSGDFRAETTSGDIELKSCDGMKVELEASSGDIEGSFITDKNYNASSSSGDVNTPANDSPNKSVCYARTSSGDIDLWVGNEK